MPKDFKLTYTLCDFFFSDNHAKLSDGVCVIGEQAKRARHYQGCTNSSWCSTYTVYIYIYIWRYVCHISSACHVYVMWAELGHSHFLYVPAVSNVVTNGNGTGTKNVLKGTVRLGLRLASSLLSTAQLL